MSVFPRHHPLSSRHLVRARLRDGWVGQQCDTARQASALFDRLRGLNPALEVQRIHDDRVIETTRPFFAPALLTADAA